MYYLLLQAGSILELIKMFDDFLPIFVICFDHDSDLSNITPKYRWLLVC